MAADRAEQLLAHRLAYEFLGRALHEPASEALVRALVDQRLFDDWPLESGEAEVQAGLALLRDYCAAPGAGQLGPLAQDQTQLFLSPGDAFVRPWESVHRNKEHLLFDQETAEVQLLYQRFGMTVPNPGLEPEDHLGLELRFVAHLSALALLALERGQPEVGARAIEALGEFLEGHLNPWAGQCLQLVIDRAGTAYYRGVALLARGCLAETTRLLASWRAG